MEFQFTDLADFLAMDGHGVYVWVAYGVTLVALSALAFYPRLRRRRLQRELQRQERILQRRRQVEEKRTPAPEPA